MQWVRERIRSASLVIADLTGSNPNVYLEVGYAWGSGVPTVLLVNDTDDLKFDVRGQRCIVYKRIKDIEEKLRKEIKELIKIERI
jgi:nucleoside 2-deoxyribosyltransferase